MQEQRQALTIHEAAAFLGVHPQTVRRLARKGEIPSFKVGRAWRFHRNALLRWSETPYALTEPAKVLLVGDEQALGTAMRGLLEDAGYRVTMASDGVEALDRLSAELPDIALLDLVMPSTNGAAILDELRARYPDLPVVLVTGHPSSELMTRALEQGPLTVMAKPVAKTCLLKAVSDGLGSAGK